MPIKRKSGRASLFLFGLGVNSTLMALIKVQVFLVLVGSFAIAVEDGLVASG